MSLLTVVRAGPLTTVQDLGRPGHAHTLLGTAVRLAEGRWVAVTGAVAPVTVDGVPAAPHSPVYAGAGATVAIGSARRGLRSYLAVGGGIAVGAVLGSRATDRLSGLGPPPLHDGDVLPLGEPLGEPLAGPAAAGMGVVRPQPAEPVLRLRPGPRDDWLTGGALDLLATVAYAVSTASDRVGLRLDGPALERSRRGELPSEALVLGALQVPADGRPVLFLPDHPTTGGYPVAGVVHPDDMPLAAQARPGSRLRFQIVRQ